MAIVDGMAAIRETFFQECAEQLAEVEAGLAAMDEGTADAETVNAVFRAVHSIKGGAGAFQLDRLVRFAHAFETVLALLRGEKIALSETLLKTMFHSNDALADLVAASRGGGEVDERRMDALTDELLSIGGGPAADPADQTDGLDFQPITLSFDEFGVGGATPDPRAIAYSITFTPRAELYQKGNETARLLRRLGQLGEMTAYCDASALPPIDKLDPGGAYLSWRIELTSDEGPAAIEEVFDFVVDDCELTIVSRQEDAPRSEDEVRVVSPGSPLAEAPRSDVAANSPEPAPSRSAAIDAARPAAEKPAGDRGKSGPASGATIRERGRR